MNRLVMTSEGRSDAGSIRLVPSIAVQEIYADELEAGEVTFLSAPNGDPLMAFWSEDFGEWSVYYSE